jgi:hypothetical protein
MNKDISRRWTQMNTDENFFLYPRSSVFIGGSCLSFGSRCRAAHVR